jgi:predicted HicB family RNase H-like nuclease
MPRGIPKKKALTAATAAPELHRITLEMPPELHARILRAATEDERSVNVYIHRFLQLNIDLIDPAGASEPTDGAEEE